MFVTALAGLNGRSRNIFEGERIVLAFLEFLVKLVKPIDIFRCEGLQRPAALTLTYRNRETDGSH
jgi:hypothetical protein